MPKWLSIELSLLLLVSIVAFVGFFSFYSFEGASITGFATSTPVPTTLVPTPTPKPTSELISCTDSDGGSNPFVKGRVEGWNPHMKEKEILVDECNGDKKVEEAVCFQDEWSIKLYAGLVPGRNSIICKNGCKNGVCLTGKIKLAGLSIRLDSTSQEFKLDTLKKSIITI